ncbi:Bro-N domain-containing protein [Mixta mediterraneensis]|uniref:BRO-N domain-containing protein n=1 Tax=Mixta mediterraneensis TaxID=2758443 RepID=UPI0018761945|nr:Bro-N domain-containing protein [Mixta mediterraneensis]MBE5254184.1 hypothetical protein [Mixta mediterraneensis]
MPRQLTFRNVGLTPVNRRKQIWFTASDLANALQYANAKSITNLFNEYADEFSPMMSEVIESVTSGNLRKKVRIFSLRGAHLLAMFARTPIAKEFRRWVLDILDQEVVRSRLPAKERVAVLCPCCRKPAVVIGTNYLTRHRVEIIARCDRLDCPDQQFKSDITFSHYLEKKIDSRGMVGFIRSLTSNQRQSLIHLLSTHA